MTPESTGGGGDAGEPRRRRKRRRRPKPKASPSERVHSAAAKPAESKGQPSRRGSRKSGATTGKDAGVGRTGNAGGERGKTGTSRGSRRRAQPHTPTVKEVSAGGVVYRREHDRIEVILASRRTRRGDLAWGLAKGGIEPNESMQDAAVREVREETGIEADIEAPLGDTKYMYVWEDVRIRKTVHFFLMRATGGDVDDRDDEMEEVRWFPLERALKRAAYRGERDVLRRAADALG